MALAVAHEAVNVNGFEWNLPGEVQAHHNHPRHPEENDVKTRHQHVSRVEGFEEIGLLRPAQRGERPQTRAKPSVENVFILTQYRVIQRVFSANFGLCAANVHVPRFVVPCRNPVPPPELAANAPVLDVAHPTEIHVFVLLRYELNRAIFDSGNRFFRQRFGRNVPLVGEPRLNHHARTVAFRYFQRVVVNFFQQTRRFKRRNNLLPRFKTV